MGQSPRLRLTNVKLIKIINYMFLAEQVGVDLPPPQGERPKCYSRLDMNPGDVSWRGP